MSDQSSPNHSHGSPISLYGGQAVVEGVMIRGIRGCAVAVRRQDGTIVEHTISLLGWANGGLRRIPLVRGVVVLLETLIIGMKAYTLAANEQLAEEDEEEQTEIGAVGIGLSMFIALLLGIAIFFLAPLFLSRAVESQSHFLANVVEGLVRLVFFLAYIWAIGLIKDIKRMYGYHGAEHMTIHAHENGRELKPEEIRRFSPAHPRCGTSFLLTVIVVSIIVFMFIPREPMWLLIGSRILLIPVIAAMSYEFIRFTGTKPDMTLVRWLGQPNLWLQRLTTKQPDDEMIEVAVTAMRHALRLDAEESSSGKEGNGQRGASVNG